MPISGLSTGLGIGLTRSVPAGAAAGGFNIDIQLTQAAILLRAGDDAGTIAFATDTFNYLVCDGNDNWAITLDVYS